MLWSAGYFFFLLASYYVLRPLRDQMGIAGGKGDLHWLFVGTLVGTVIVTPLFAALVSRTPRRVFVPIVYRVLAANLVVFYVLLASLSGPARLATAYVFFVWTSVFNMFAVSVFWGFLVDVFDEGQGKRLFGLIGVGGTAGAVFGSFLTTLLAKPLGPDRLLLLAAVLLELSVQCARGLSRTSSTFATAASRKKAEEPPGRGVFTGISLIARSPYLLGICLFLLLFTVSSTFLYFAQARIVRDAVAGAAERTAYFARIDLYVNILTAATQALVTSSVLVRLGVGVALSVLPAITLGGFFALALQGTAAMLALVQVVRRAAEFALVRPAREVLFTVVTREEKYSSKSFVDTFVYRGGDVVGAFFDRLLVTLGLTPLGLALAFVPIGGAWLLLCASLARGQKRRARDLAGEVAAARDELTPRSPGGAGGGAPPPKTP